MKITAFLVAFGPALAAVAIKFAIQPSWLSEFSFLACLGLGALTCAARGNPQILAMPPWPGKRKHVAI